MRNTTRKLPLVLTGLLGLSGASALADSINPTSVTTTLAAGECLTYDATVTVDAGTPTSSKVDVLFLADDTGSMGGIINAIRTSAGSILSSTAGLGDVAFAVARYGGETGASSFTLRQDLTTSQATAQAAINTWSASGGGDGPEANLYGLENSATDTSWRAGSERIIVWFGDAPGHDPSPGGATPPGGKVNEAQTIAALQAAGINVQAVDVGSMNSTGQATRITNATGGDLYSGINTGSIVSTITDAITTSISEYTMVGLDLSEVPAGVTVTTVPPAHIGMYDRSIARDFTFEVTVCNDSGGDHSFDIYGTVDRGRVAAERININGGTSSVPDGGSTALLLGAALAGMGGLKPLRKLLKKS